MLGANQLHNIQTIVLLSAGDQRLDHKSGGYHYDLTLNDNNASAGATLTVNGNQLTDDTMRVDGSAVTDDHLHLFGGANNDTLVGGTLSDTLSGGAGADTLTGGDGADTFSYSAASQSTSSHFDKITDFDFSLDKLHFSGSAGKDTFLGTLEGGALSLESFDKDLAGDLKTSLSASGSVLFEASSGNEAGKWFLVVDANHTAGYQAGADYVIQVDPHGALPTAGNHFIG